MVARQLVASARNLVIVRPTRNATRNATRIYVTRIYVTEKETRKGIKTGIATVTVTGSGNARETGTETMIAIATATEKEKETETEIGSERETATAIVKRTETVVPGITVDMTTTHGGHRVTTVVIANVIGIVIHREIAETESVIDTRHEDQVRDGKIENGAAGGTKRKEVAMTSRARNERPRPMSEVRRYTVYRSLSQCLFLTLTLIRREQDTMWKPLLRPRTKKRTRTRTKVVVLKHRRKERYDWSNLPNNFVS